MATSCEDDKTCLAGKNTNWLDPAVKIEHNIVKHLKD